MINESHTGKQFIGKCFKRKYTTKCEAKKAIKHRKRYRKKVKHCYECAKCGFWHLSSLSELQYKEKQEAWKLIKFLENDLAEA